MNQMLLGAIAPFIASVAVYVRRGCRASLCMLLVAPLATGLCAVWAVVPDIPRVTGHHDLYHHLRLAKWTDIFFMHYTVDAIEMDVAGYMYGLIAMVLAFLAAAWRELYLLERRAHESGLEHRTGDP